MKYIIKRIGTGDLDPKLIQFIGEAGKKLNQQYDQNYDYNHFPIREFVKKHYLCVCYRDGSPVGFLAASLFSSFFDSKCRILYQNLLYSLPNTRATYFLLRDFIDFGRLHANHIITVIAEKSNIKPQSLIKLGFKKLEESYRMET